MDEDTIKKEGIKPLLEVLHRVADLFPVKESAFRRRTPLSAQDSKDLGSTVLFLTKLGVPALLSFGAGADDKDPDSVAVQVSPPWRIGLPAKELYGDASVTKKYEDTIKQILAVLNPDHSNENATLHAQWMKSDGHAKIASRGHSEDFAHEVVEFEKRLAAASPDAEDSNDVTVSRALM